MPALIDLRRRIRSVRNTQQITQAMKTVSTAKFKKSQRIISEARPFWHTIPEIIFRMGCWSELDDHPLLQRREEKRIEGVVITSDKGLCGAFNSNLLSTALSFFEEKAREAELRLVVMGKKAWNFFKKKDFPIDRAYAEKIDKLTPEELKDMAQFLMRLFIHQKRDAVYVIYNEFKSILAPRITVAKLLPLDYPKQGENLQALWPDWEPEKSAVLNFMLPFYVENQINHCYFESQAAENAARMMAMDNATKNAEELIKDLILVLNKIRQTSITKELLEIMTAVEALKK